jgi:oligosaccharyltransferase complex subunit gamma
MRRQGLGKILFLVVALALVTLLIVSFIPSPANAQTTEELIAKKVSRLQAKAAKSKGIIELDSIAFDDVLAKPRNYSMVVLFTAISPEFQCAPCKYVLSHFPHVLGNTYYCQKL